MVIYCLPISSSYQVSDEKLMEYNNIENEIYENFENNNNNEEIPAQTVWYGKDNIISHGNIYEQRLSNTMLQFSYENVHRQWPTKTAYKCFWCCHSFDTRPCFIPWKRVDNIFHVHGNFCSFNCAVSYNNNESSCNWSYKTELLHYLYRLIYNNKDEIKPAPSKEVLLDFGGNVSIQEFRSNFTNDVNYELIFPPIISTISQISESIKLKKIEYNNEIKCKPIQKQLFKKSKKMVQRKLFS
jgi:hypothetical protein